MRAWLGGLNRDRLSRNNPLQLSCGIRARGTEMAKKALKRRPWTKEDVRTLKTLAREKTKTIAIARKLKRGLAATYQQASKLGVMLGGGRGSKGA
jgi:hypothetical protein